MTLLEFHEGLARKMVAGSQGYGLYRELLERIVGIPLDGVRITTAEHSAPYNRASTISFVLPQLAMQKERLVPPTPILVLAASLVPMDNSHYPRGFYIPEGEARNDRFNLVPKSLRKRSPLLLPPACVKTLPDAERFFELYPWIKGEFDDAALSSTYAHQMTACMQRIIAQWVPDDPSACVHVRPLEDIACRFLIELLERRDPGLNRMLFDSHARKQLAVELDGVACAWGERHGSFLFWGSHQGQVVRLREVDNHLIGEDTRIPFEPDAVRYALCAGKLLPGVFLSLLAVSYFPNLSVSGGARQLQYFRQMIQAANQAGAGSRSIRISLPGYMASDFRLIRPWKGATGMPDFGTGLALASRTPDMRYILEQMAQIQ
jgi:hypothetical protein